jgi:hypothetical protein
VSARPTRVQDILGRALGQHVDPALRAAGLSRHGRRSWHRRVGDAWVALGIEVDKYATRTDMVVDVLANAWPPGTATSWLIEPHDVPPVGGNAPFSAWPGEVDPGRERCWRVDLDTSADELGRDLAGYCVQVALPWARVHLDVDRALRTVLPTHVPPRWALEMLEHAAPDHPRRRQLAEAYVADWVRDPRTITDREWVAALIEELRLPPRELPTWMSMYLSPSHVDEMHGGDALAAWRKRAADSPIYLADGTWSLEPPPHGLGPMGVRAEQLPHRQPSRLLRRLRRG